MAELNFSGPKLSRLPLDFYTRTDVVLMAKELLGKVLVTEFEGRRSSGMITETEAYRALDDRACHAFGNRRTARTEVMFQEGGRAYVYLCYGIHHLFNVVTGAENDAHAVLIRSIAPLEGIDQMLERRYGSKTRSHSPALTTGPGALSQALGIKTFMTGQSLVSPDTPVWIEEHPEGLPRIEIAEGPRIGVDYAGECALWNWRFWVKNSPFVKK